MKNTLFLGLLSLVIVATAGSIVPAESTAQIAVGYPGSPDVHPGLMEALEQAQQEGARNPVQDNLRLVSFLDLGGPDPTQPVLSSDVWAHRDTAYVGGLGVDVGATVKVIDISDPTNPQLINELPTPDGTSPQDVKAAAIKTDFFKGDLLAVANDGAGIGGIQLWDVSDPSNPILLSEPRYGPVHNLFLYQKGGRAFVLLAASFAEVFSGSSPFDPLVGDFVVVEVTDPENPAVIGDWGAGKDGGFPFGFPGFPGPCDVCRGQFFPAVYLHDVWVNGKGTVAYLSYWDLGLILLDISTPETPVLIGRGIEPPTFGNDEGDAHVAVPTKNGKIVLVGDETFLPGDTWDFIRVFDTSDPTNPVQIGAFATDSALNQPDPNVPSSVHNIIIRGKKAYLSWYFDGIRVVDFSEPTAPVEVAAFTAPPGTGLGVFWGVYLHDDLILGSDIVSGLYILEEDDDEDEDEDDDEDSGS